MKGCFAARGRFLGASAAFGLAAALGACGYHPLYGGGGDHLHIALVRSLVADPIAADEVLASAREELARRGVLEAGDGFPRVEIEVLRATESSQGIATHASQPAARAIGMTLLARAWVIRGPGGEPERDTGDFRSEEDIAADGMTASSVPADRPQNDFQGADASRAAARRLGRALARAVMGEPTVDSR